MCIIFVYINRVAELGFKLILAANRDEVFNRPAAEAAFWQESPNILAGKDLADGKEGGVWIGITKNGYVGAITNLWGKNKMESCESRGVLLSNFLLKCEDPKTYATAVFEKAFDFNGFNLILGKFPRQGDPALYFVNNHADRNLTELNGVHCISNGGIDNSWKKSTNGTKKFRELIENATDRGALVSELLLLLKDKTRYSPDEDDSFEGVKDKNYGKLLSAIFVETPRKVYGTRTHTVILIDSENKVTFVEETMTDPMDHNDHKWKSKMFEFELEEQ